MAEALNLFIFGNLEMNIQADIISFATAITCCEHGMQWYRIIHLLGSAIEMSTSSTSLRHPSLAVKEKQWLGVSLVKGGGERRE